MESNNPFAHRLVRASAGSGKTYNLSLRFLSLLIDGVPLDSILATTFTRKAAGEIQDRVLLRLGEGAASDEGAAELSKALGRRLDRNYLKELLRRVVNSLNQLRAQTLDSFFIMLARQYEPQLGLTPNWRISEEIENNRLLSDAIQNAFSDANNAVRLSRLLFKGSLDRSIENQITTLVNNSLDIYDETRLNIGRSNDPWEKMASMIPNRGQGGSDDIKNVIQQNLVSLMNADPPPKQVNNFNKAREGIATAVQEGLQRNSWKEFMKRGFVSKALSSEPVYYKIEIPPVWVEAVRGLVSNIRSLFFSDLSDQTLATRATLASISEFFERSKSEEAAYRFTDVSRRLSEFFLKQKTKGALEETLTTLELDTWHVLLDEFQDASLEQWAIVEPFAERIERRSLKGDSKGSFYCVGDEKQAIYGWRGGVAEIFGKIQEKFGENLEESPLNVNWRSCGTIIDVVNRLFDNRNLAKNIIISEDDLQDDTNPNKPIYDAFQNWSARFTTHKAHRENEKGYWELVEAPAALAREEEETVSQDDWFDDVDDEEEASLERTTDAAARKQALLEYAVDRIEQLYRDYPGTTIGVLTRSNAPIARIIGKLKKRGVYASEEGGAVLTDSPAVGAVLSYLTYASHPGDTVARFHLDHLRAVHERLQVPFLNVKLTRPYELRDEIAAWGIGKFIERLRKDLVSLCISPRDVDRLDKLIEFAYSYETNTAKFDLDQFIKAVRETKVEAPSEARVRVMTLHKSKGLEFDIVVLPELDSPLLKLKEEFFVGREDPTSPINAVVKKLNKDERKLLLEEGSELKKIFDDASRTRIEEALCLLYVGVTRPRRMLVAIVSSKNSKALTYAKILRDTLAVYEEVDVDASQDEEQAFEDLTKARVLFSTGDLDWLKKSDVVKDSLRSYLSPDVPIVRSDKKRLLFHRETPTGDRAKRQWTSQESYQQGSAIHACFETIDWYEDSNIFDEKALREIISTYLFDEEERNFTIERYRQMIESDFCRALLSRASYERPTPETECFFAEAPSAATLPLGVVGANWSVYRERPFSISYKEKGASKGRLVRGTIDRLVVLRDAEGRVLGADVVDYKTDRRCEGWQIDGNRAIPSAETLDEYGRQLQAYGDVVARWYSLPPEKISLRLAFVSEGYALDARRGILQDASL